jgi:hypothetical protein
MDKITIPQNLYAIVWYDELEKVIKMAFGQYIKGVDWSILIYQKAPNNEHTNIRYMTVSNQSVLCEIPLGVVEGYFPDG